MYEAGTPRVVEPEAMALTAGEVASLAGGRLAAGLASTPIGEITTDSRRVAPGGLFIALRGERFDGHAFVAQAIAMGATTVLVDDPRAIPEATCGAAVVVAADALVALQAVARGIRRASGARVVAITGSAGKTTTKEITAALLAPRLRTYRSPGNLNNHVGLPLSLLDLRRRPEVAVVELGMNHAGEIRTLVALAEPEIRVWTNVAPVHAGHFASLEAIADAKAEILEGARPDHLLVANADDPLVMSRARRFAGRVSTYGVEALAAGVRAVEVRMLGLDGSSARLVTWKGEADLRVPLAGRGNLSNVLAAVTVALELDAPLDSLPDLVARLRPSRQRGEIHRLPGGVTLVDDTYNSNPAALEQALQAIAAETRCGRKVAVLGEMLELGAGSALLHQACGRAVAGSGVVLLITVGGEPARALGRAAVEAGLDPGAVSHAATSEEAAERAAAIVRPGDLVLVKGSRGIGTEAVSERLKRDFA